MRETDAAGVERDAVGGHDDDEIQQISGSAVISLSLSLSLSLDSNRPPSGSHFVKRKLPDGGVVALWPNVLSCLIVG